MIDITRLHDDMIDARCDLADARFLYDCAKADYRYAAGIEPPNYPVPAIRYHVDAGRTGVAIWNNSKYEAIMLEDEIYCMMPDYEYP